MANVVMEVPISDNLKTRLEAASRSRGQSLPEFLQEALYTYVEDIEDGALSDVALSESGLDWVTPDSLTANGGNDVGVERGIHEVSRKTA